MEPHTRHVPRRYLEALKDYRLERVEAAKKRCILSGPLGGAMKIERRWITRNASPKIKFLSRDRVGGLAERGALATTWEANGQGGQKGGADETGGRSP